MPNGLSLDSSTATSIAISWGRVACAQRNGEIVGYRVTYRRAASPITKRQLGEVLVMDIVGTADSDRQFMATGLFPRTSYTFSVVAVSSEGETGVPATITGVSAVPDGQYCSALVVMLLNSIMTSRIFRCGSISWGRHCFKSRYRHVQ